MNGIKNAAWAGALGVLTMTVFFASRRDAHAQLKIQPVQPGTMQGGINQTPWFSNPAVRQQFNLNNEQYTNLNQAYQDAWSRYQQGVNGLSNTLTGEQRQQKMHELQQGFHKDLGNASGTILAEDAQRQRYNQLHWQYRAYGAFQDPAVAAKLNLTPEQRAKFDQLHGDWTNKINDIAAIYQTDRADAVRRFTQLQYGSNQGVNSVLSPAQQKTWQQLIGNPYPFQPEAYFQVKSLGGGKK
jgi:hypothetical protein